MSLEVATDILLRQLPRAERARLRANLSRGDDPDLIFEEAYGLVEDLLVQVVEATDKLHDWLGTAED